jgi:hypothetical protein
MCLVRIGIKKALGLLVKNLQGGEGFSEIGLIIDQAFGQELIFLLFQEL